MRSSLYKGNSKIKYNNYFLIGYFSDKFFFNHSIIFQPNNLFQLIKEIKFKKI